VCSATIAGVQDHAVVASFQPTPCQLCGGHMAYLHEHQDSNSKNMKGAELDAIWVTSCCTPCLHLKQQSLSTFQKQHLTAKWRVNCSSQALTRQIFPAWHQPECQQKEIQAVLLLVICAGLHCGCLPQFAINEVALTTNCEGTVHALLESSSCANDAARVGQ